MSTKDNVRCVCCGSDDAFEFFDFSLNGKKRGSCRTCEGSWDVS